ncbi:MAG: hypothetical protein M0Q51_16510 [Bacteroidales bacterium]|nr:hypothetical protein [Bacteroidales bacterium]
MMKYLFFSFILLFVKISIAQNEANIWYFNNYCGLDFNSGTPDVLYDGQTNTWGGSAAITDTLGNLLFYTDGHTVYNKNQEFMSNGLGLVGQSDCGVAIVKLPNSDNIYYVFTVAHVWTGWQGFYYSIFKNQKK